MAEKKVPIEFEHSRNPGFYPTSFDELTVEQLVQAFDVSRPGETTTEYYQRRVKELEKKGIKIRKIFE